MNDMLWGIKLDGISIIRNGVMIMPPPIPKRPAINPVKQPNKAIRPIVVSAT